MIFENIKNKLELNQFEIVSMDQNGPWGGFFVISEEQTQKFVIIILKDWTFLV